MISRTLLILDKEGTTIISLKDGMIQQRLPHGDGRHFITEMGWQLTLRRRHRLVRKRDSLSERGLVWPEADWCGAGAAQLGPEQASPVRERHSSARSRLVPSGTSLSGPDGKWFVWGGRSRRRTDTRTDTHTAHRHSLTLTDTLLQSITHILTSRGETTYRQTQLYLRTDYFLLRTTTPQRFF